MTEKSPADESLTRIPLLTAGTGIAILLILLAISAASTLIYGFLVGLGLVITNFVLLTKIVAKFVDQNYKRKPLMGVVFFVKLLLTGGILYLSFKVFQLSVLGFALGFICLMPAILFQQLKGQPTSKTV